MAKKNDYEDLLNTSWDDIADEVILPNGEWLLAIRNLAFKKSEKEGTNDKVLVFFTPKSPVNVEASLLAELPDDYDLATNQIVYTIWIEGPRDWAKVRKLLETAGVVTQGKTQSETFKAAKGAEVIAVLDERSFADRDGVEQVENTASSFRPASE